MTKKHIISLFSIILSAAFFAMWNILRNIGIFILWIPQNLYTVLEVDKDQFNNAIITLMQKDNTWAFTVGNMRDSFLYVSIVFLVLALISFGLSFKKRKKSN